MASPRPLPPRRCFLVGGCSVHVAVVFLSLVALSKGDDSKLAIVNLFTGASNGAVCVKYFPAFKVLPGEKSEATARPLTNMVAQDGCQPLRGINLTDSVVLINDSGRCSLENVSRNYHNVGAYGLLVGLSDDVLDDATYRRESSDAIDIVVMFSSRTKAISLVKLLARLEPTTALTFTKEYELDAAIALIWFFAVFCVGAGAYWAGSESHRVYNYQAQRSEERRARRHAPPTKLPARPTGAAAAGDVPAAGAGAGAGDAAQKKREKSEQSEELFELEFTPRSIICFVIFMSSMLLVLYVFIRYLVYVIIGMFVLASAIALIGVLEPVVRRLPVGTTTVSPKALPCFFVPVEVRQLLLIVFSVAVSFSFVVVRNESWSWILQDVLGTIFSVYMIRTIRMPSLKVISLLLVLLFFYDIIFVFLTPLILPRSRPHNTTNSFAQSAGRGDSVMVEVATGGGTGESVPMVMRVPRFTTADMAACLGGYSLLGLGDILIPGFLVAYVHGFDLISSPRRLYYITTMVGYAMGLLLTFLSLYLMKMAQPALLYLVPCTLLPVVAIAWKRGELYDMWHGRKPETPHMSEEEEEEPGRPPGRKASNDQRRTSTDQTRASTESTKASTDAGTPKAQDSAGTPQPVVSTGPRSFPTSPPLHASKVGHAST